MRNGLRVLTENLRRRPQTLAGAALAALMTFLTASMISSCVGEQAPPAVAPEPIGPAGADGDRRPPTIRVRLDDNTRAARIAVTGAHAIVVDGVQIAAVEQGQPDIAVVRIGTAWRIGGELLPGDRLEIRPLGRASMVRLGRRTYHGSLVLTGGRDAGDFHVDNYVDLERYLAGVLSRELYPNWHEQTYSALAVASRTYALYVLRHEGRQRAFDVYADQRSQVYGGVSDETDKSRRAVAETWGQVMVHQSDQGPRVFKAFFSSACGGVTNPAEALEPGAGDGAAPLAGGVRCDDCDFSPRYRWDPVTVEKGAVYRALARTYRPIAAMGSMRELRVSERTSWGRPIWVEIEGGDGATDRVRADDLRLCLLRAGVAPDLYSANCQITDTGDSIVFSQGRGFGHGVGLCQYGAEGKARRGMRYYEILYSYYPGAEIKQAW